MGRLVGAKAGYAVVVLLISGCSSSKMQMPVAESNPEEQAIFQVGLAYQEATKALKKPPDNIKTLKPYLKKYGDPDKLLISPNDGQPYQISWGVTPRRPPKSSKQNAFVVYEQTGKDGQRYVLDFMFKVRRVTDKQFETMRGMQ